MQLPQTLRQAIGQTRILPLIGPGRMGSEGMLAIYEAAAAVAHRCVLSLTSDRHLYGVLQAADANWMLLSSGLDRIDEDRRLLIQLAGAAGTGANRLTPAMWGSGADLLLGELSRSYAARAPLLVLGCDPSDEGVLDIVADLRPNRHFQPVGWFVTSDDSPMTRLRWQSLGFELVPGPLPEVLQELRNVGAALPRVRQVAGRRSLAISNPYKHLESFTRADGDLFFGRTRETQRLIELVCANRLVVTTGPSGTGKTSLLQAGLLAWSDRNPPFVGIYSRCGENPEASVATALSEALGHTRSSPGRTVLELLETFVTSRRGVPVVVLDQAEELFTRFNESLRSRFLTTLRQLLTRPDLHARLVLGIRDDFLARLADVRHLVPSILQNTFYVPPMGRAAALEAIRQPSLAVGVEFEPTVAERILDEIGRERVAPPQIQIVCDKLFRQRSRGDISLALYERVGGAPAILTQFMEDQLGELGSQHDLARDVLKAMVTAEGTKDTLTASEIARRASRQPKQVESILFRMRDVSRLVRTVEAEGGVRFELVHEYLTTSIWSWLSEDDRFRREVEELLIKELRAWRQFRTLRLGADRLRRFTERPDLLNYDAEAITLLLLSTVTHQRDSAPWVQRLKRLGDGAEDAVATELFSYFSDKNLNQRCEAAEVIAALEPAPIVRALQSPAAAQRRAAIEMLGGIGLASATQRLIECLEDQDPVCRELACGALGAIGGPAVLSVLVGVTRGTDMLMVCAAFEALGRQGLAESYLDLVTGALSSKNTDVRSAVERALSSGNSMPLLKQLLTKAAPASPLAASVWRAVETLPISHRPWLKELLKDAKTSVLDGGKELPISCWVGEDVQSERLHRGLPSKFVRWSQKPEVSRVIGKDFTSVEEDLDKSYAYAKAEIIQELGKHGNTINELVARLSSHRKPSLRCCATRIVAARGSRADTPFASQIVEQAITDPDATVREGACRLAAQLQLWPFLDQVLRAEQEPEVRAATIQGLISAPPTWVVPVHAIERGLESINARLRYWACLAARNRNLIELTALIRPLMWDSTSVANTGYDTERDWVRHDETVGHSVAAAANAALEVLSPSSDVWRKHRTWQVDFQTSRKAD